MSADERLQLRAQVKEMFQHGYDSYMRHAFPMDELAPLSCGGMETWGGYSLTLIDSLDTLAVMGNQTEFERACRWVSEHIAFDRNVTVSVFETNIRVLGGLLSAHLILSGGPHQSSGPMPPITLQDGFEYKGQLLDLAFDLGKRLLPAFNTTTGIPYGVVNLKYGVPEGETTVTSTAGGGTFLLEFGVLSRLTGDRSFENAARKASKALFTHRSRLGLVGNHIDVQTGEWTHKDAGVGAGSDSFYEYLLKGYMLFRDDEYWYMWNEVRQGVSKHLHRRPWYVDVNMFHGVVVWPLFNSLQAFWPGVMALAGHVEEASETLKAFHSVWRRYGCVPEGFNLLNSRVQPGQKGYPLRPEMAESAYMLYSVTRDPSWLLMGRDMVTSIQAITRTECGYASVQDVETHALSDRMESFFLAETLKYLYLLFDEDNKFAKGLWTFNTEGHLLPLDPVFAMGWDSSEEINAHYNRTFEHWTARQQSAGSSFSGPGATMCELNGLSALFKK